MADNCHFDQYTSIENFLEVHSQCHTLPSISDCVHWCRQKYDENYGIWYGSSILKFIENSSNKLKDAMSNTYKHVSVYNVNTEHNINPWNIICDLNIEYQVRDSEPPSNLFGKASMTTQFLHTIPDVKEQLIDAISDCWVLMSLDCNNYPVKEYFNNRTNYYNLNKSDKIRNKIINNPDIIITDLHNNLKICLLFGQNSYFDEYLVYDHKSDVYVLTTIKYQHKKQFKLC